MNDSLESVTTLNTFLEMTCTKMKDVKSVKELLNSTPSKGKNNYTKVRDQWLLLIAPYTQICRITIVLWHKQTLNNQHLCF